MPININALYERVNFLGAKDRSGGSLTPKEFNNTVPAALYTLLSGYIGSPEKYAPGSPTTPIAYDVSQLVSDMFDEIKMFNVSLPVNNGIAMRPSDYLYLSSIYTRYFKNVDTGATGMTVSDCCGTVQGSKVDLNQAKIIEQRRRVKVVTDGHFDFHKISRVRPATLEYPICRIWNGQIEFAPMNVTGAFINYLRKPKDPVWGYTIANGEPIYDAATSIDVELPQIYSDRLAYVILSNLGVSIREVELYQAAQNYKATGG